MRTSFLTLAVIGFLITPSYAQTSIPSHEIIVKVNGLVCDFCARTVEKVFTKREEVQAVNVNLDTHEIMLNLKNNADIPDPEITTLVEDAGYSVVEIIRDHKS